MSDPKQWSTIELQRAVSEARADERAHWAHFLDTLAEQIGADQPDKARVVRGIATTIRVDDRKIDKKWAAAEARVKARAGNDGAPGEEEDGHG